MTHQPAATQAAEFIREQWNTTAAALLAIHLGLELPELRDSFNQAETGEGQRRLENVAFRRKDGSERIEQFLSPIGLALRRRRHRRDFEKPIVMGMISLCDAVLDEHCRFDKGPLLEFVRHLRNGISHGNRFYFNGKQPTRKACFKNFTIAASMQNDRVLFDYIDIGDVFDLFEEVEKHLMELQ